jgi:two-component system, OmpR family, sensor histidine kinase VicK
VYNDIRRIGEISRDGVFIYDPVKGSFEYVNDAFARLFELEKEALKEQPGLIFPLIRSEDSFYLRHRLSELERDKTISNIELRVYFKDASVRHLLCDAFEMTESSWVGFVKDVTKEKEHEDYIIDYGAKKDTLLDMMTHNLSGPLNLSQNILRWMQQTYKDKTPGEVSSQLHLIQENTKQCLEIVNDFLKQEHLESERIYVKKTRFDVLDRIIATLDKLVATNKSKKFSLVTNLKNLNINTDGVKFFQVVHNLVSNAIKFTPDNGHIEIVVEETETTFIVRVRDNGIGIPLRLQPSLFDRRTVAGRDGLNNEMSTGLGLSIVKRLVTLLDGRIWFESEENKGSIFSIELPKN